MLDFVGVTPAPSSLREDNGALRADVLRSSDVLP